MKLINLGEGLDHIVDMEKINDDSIIIDAGANVGLFVEKMRTLTNATIYSIECSRRSCDIIRQKNLSNIHLRECALVGDDSVKIILSEFAGEMRSDGTNKYHQWGNVVGNHVSKFNSDPNVNVVQYEVESCTLENFLKKENISKVDYLKMDIEGAEYDVIDNITPSLANKIEQISLETHDLSKNDKMVQKLQSLGFVVKEVANNEYYAFKKEI